MDNATTKRTLQKGQIVTPASIRKALGLTKGTELSFRMEGDEITIERLPAVLDWASLVKQIPAENIGIDREGHYDPKKSPEFHDWMVSG